MILTPDNHKDLAAMPPALRALLDAELAAGNELVEIGHGFPAAPCGAYFKLSCPLLTQPRESGGGINFYDRDMPGHSGEITDAQRHFFILEPPHPPPVEPETRVIHDAPCSHETSDRDVSESGLEKEVPVAVPDEEPATVNGPLQRFKASMAIDYEKWHDGIGYDLDVLSAASPAERDEIENLLVERATNDWRDVEALAALGTQGARDALASAFRTGNHAIRAAVMRHAPEIVSGGDRIASLVRALESAEFYGGLTQTLDEVAEFHPPEIVEALRRGVLQRDGATAVHFAAMLMFIHGKAQTPFDWDLRPFFLKFHTDDPEERKAHYNELCALIERSHG